VKERIQTHVLDLLEADVRLYAGGAAYRLGWGGVTRPENPDESKPLDPPRAGYVNLFDSSYEPDAGTHRPGVFLGSRAMEVSDRLDFPSVSAGSRLEYRVMLLPLVIAVQVAGGSKQRAKAQRNQLWANVRAILFGHFTEGGYWYELTMPGDAGGGAAREHAWVSNTGSGNQSVAEAMTTLPLIIRYSYKGSSPA
jgi:hypothetical protein